MKNRSCKKIKFTNAFLRSDNNKVFDLYSKEEVLKIMIDFG